MPGRNSQVARIYALLDILDGSGRGLTVVDLTSRLEDRGHSASRRTVYRDLEALEQAGFPLVAEGDGDSQAALWRLNRVARINEHLVLTSRELLALFLAKGVLTPLKDTPFYEGLDSVFKKLEERIGSRNQGFLGELSREITFEPGPRWGLGIDPDVLETLRSACAERHILKIRYASANSGQETDREIGPHYLYFGKGSLYIVAEDLGTHQVKVFAVPRVKNALMLEQEYEGSITDPAEFFDGTLGVFRAGQAVPVKIQFSSRISPYVRERRWHETQSIVSHANGSIVLSIDVAITPELTNWVLGFGAEAVVLEPLELKTELARVSGEVAKLYSKKAG